MTGRQVPDVGTVRAVVESAARAPSLHNSQPWRWRWDGTTADLHVDAERLLPATDMFNREGVLGCGVVLQHAEVAWAAAGWHTRTSLFPEPTVRAHVAAVEPVEPRPPTAAQRCLAAAIGRRYTDRMPMDAPPEWLTTSQVLTFLAHRFGTTATFLDADQVTELRRISALTTRVRRYDPRYQDELRWWTAGPEHGAAGVPSTALPGCAEVPLNREFPVGTLDADPAAGGADDAAAVAVLSTTGDSAVDLLDCGRALSAVLLDCTQAGLSTGTVTHVVELPSARLLVSELVGQRFPQVLVRIGGARTPAPPRTPRRPVDSMLELTAGPQVAAE
ncbi:Acg family FMN-binding oxidoreductase [Nocardia rhizosphaerae]|uniref:Acg family FMN-binding oxidoreductase n=1 Tax=Nocardia rhizosphaerae TaxID=1691571 RepID=A0ABV8LE08_9NOCA